MQQSVGLTTYEFHSLQAGQRPRHWGHSSPHSLQRKRSLTFAALATAYRRLCLHASRRWRHPRHAVSTRADGSVRGDAS